MQTHNEQASLFASQISSAKEHRIVFGVGGLSKNEGVRVSTQEVEARNKELKNKKGVS